MIKLFLDIETLPADESYRGKVAATIRPPASMKKADTIQKWEADDKPAAIEKAFRETSFKGTFGRILCIGYVKEAPSGETEGVLSGDEPSILREFWELSQDVDLFIGHNIFDFDLKFITQRSMIHGVRPTKAPSFARYRSDSVYDTMAEWACWSQDRIRLGDLAEALGIKSPKDAMDGSQVYDYYRDGRSEEIYEYCLKDVKATRSVYKRMTFEE